MRSDVAMTSIKITSLNLNTFKGTISNWHKFCLIMYKNNVIRIRIVEIMALYCVFLDHPLYIYVIVNDYKIKYEDGKKEKFKNALCS